MEKKTPRSDQGKLFRIGEKYDVYFSCRTLVRNAYNFGANEKQIEAEKTSYDINRNLLSIILR